MENTLDKNLGFHKNPFSKKSSEQELDFINEIFYTPNYYATLVDDLISGDSRFIIGQRGHGKTSIINKLHEDIEKKGKIFVSKIDRFENIPVKENEANFLFVIITTLIQKLILFLLCNKKSVIKKLDKTDKECLHFFLEIFYKPITESEFKDACNKIKNYKIKLFFTKLFNRFGIDFVNLIVASALEISSDFIRKSFFNNVPCDYSFISKQYISKISTSEIEKKELKAEDFEKGNLKNILYKICDIYEKIGFKKVIVLFDKIDESQQLQEDISKIAVFTKDILSDTELLLNNKLSIGFSLWSELKEELSGIVRFDKLGTIDVRWKTKDMQPLIDLRLHYFSIDKNKPRTLNDLITSKLDQDEIVNLANKSPRDLIFILSEIHKEQANREANVNAYSDDAIRNGMTNFCKSYDYDSMIPSKTGKNKDVKSMIRKLLSAKHIRFTFKELSSSLNQNDRQSQGQINTMLNYHLIREEEIPADNGLKIYEIIDPKVVYMIKNLIERIE